MEAPKLDFVFDLKLDFHTRLRFGPTYSGGMVGFVGIAGGTVTGPRLNAQVVPNSGGDWAEMRPDGIVAFHAHYLLETDDGTMIHIHNQGFGRAPAKPLALEQEVEESERQLHYFRVAPRFEVAVGPHDWLTRTLIIGAGERRTNPDHTVFHYYAVL